MCSSFRFGLLLTAVLVAVQIRTIAGGDETIAGEFPEHFLSLLEPGQRVFLSPVEDNSSYDLQLVPRPSAAGPDKSFRIAARGGDYVVLVGGKMTMYVPLHSIRAIVAASDDPLSTPISVAFQRLPLRDAMADISQKIGIEIRIDGEALKFEGLTQNMPQTLGAVDSPAERILQTMLGQYAAGLVVTIHDDHYLLTSGRVADKEKWPIRKLNRAPNPADAKSAE